MPSLLNAAKYLVKEYGFALIYLDEPMFQDPIVPASQAELFESLHVLMCAATGQDPTYVSVRRVVDWIGQAVDWKSMKAHA
jgi:hypothetical protein